MGASTSKQQPEQPQRQPQPQSAEEVAPICVDCDKKTQKDLPSDNSSPASEGKPCAKLYANVMNCMELQKGQISSCRPEWAEFRQCHAKSKKLVEW